jgi:predicted DsbA family dithiol-disulfide isomerase
MVHLSSQRQVVIEIVSDVICPWCWVGKRKLETALKTYSNKNIVDAQIIWKPYQLRPGTPIEGTPKEPDTPDNPRVGLRLKGAGASVGIDFTGKTDRTPNTLLAHVLLEYTLDKYGWKMQNEMQEAIFQSYFTDGIFLSKENLVSIATKVLGDKKNNSRHEIEFALEDESLIQKARDEIMKNLQKNRGHGVPFFMFNGRHAFSGAQDPKSFHQVFDYLLSEE